jgi:hypothetical protein
MNLIHKLIIAGCLVAAFSSCRKDNPTPANFISFKINGVYKSIKPEADIFDDGTFLLDAGPFMKDEIGLFLNTNVMLKTYHFENQGDNALGDYYDHSGTHFWSDTGTLVVTSFDGRHINGTFSFKARTLAGPPASIDVTDGQFSADVSYLSAATDTCSWYDSTVSVSRLNLLIGHLNKRQMGMSTQ